MTESAERVELVGRLADLIRARSQTSTLRVAVDGIDAAGKTTLADELAQHLRRVGVPVLRSSLDGFHHPTAIRHRRADDQPARSYYEDSFDHRTLRSVLLDPLQPGGDHTVRTRIFDFRTDRPIVEDPVHIQRGTVLLFDGVFLLRPELKGCWDLTMFLRVDPEISLSRAMERDTSLFGTPEATERRYGNRYIPGQKLYLSLVHPEQRADILIDNNDPARPELIRIPSA